MKTVKTIAPAKVNLFLGIGTALADGYHRVITAMHSLALHDTVQVTHVQAGEDVLLVEPGDAAQPLRELALAVEPGSGLAVSAHMIWSAGLEALDVSDEENLACRAVRELARVLGRSQDEHVRLVVEKQIPYQTGLGGGSSDAAAALVGIATLWGVNPYGTEVRQAAQQVGADVAFFLHGGCAVLEGRGDVFVRSLDPRRDSVVVVKPQGGVSTAQAYRTFDENPVAIGDDKELLLQTSTSALDVPLFNNLAPASERLHNELRDVRAFLESQLGVQGVLLCGSGAGTFAICDTFASAHALAAAAQRKGWWARSTTFAPLGAAVLPG